MKPAMAMTRTQQDELLDELVQRGMRLYENQLKAILERDCAGQVVAIHPDSGDYAVATKEQEAVSNLRLKQPAGLFFVRRIGPPTAGDSRLAARVAGQLRGK